MPQKKPCSSAKGKKVHKESIGNGRRLEKTTVSQEEVMGDQIEDLKRKLCDFVKSNVVDTVPGKKLKLDDAVSLGKVFKDQFGSAEVAKQSRREQ